MRYAVLLFALTVAAMLTPGIHGRTIARAQDPFPQDFLRSCEPHGLCPSEGQRGWVIQGLAIGVGGQDHTMDDTVFLTLANVQAHVPVITEVTPQSAYGSLQDWENAILQLVERIEAWPSPTEVGAYWGGILLDLEEGFWHAHPDQASNVADLGALTNYTAVLMANAPCCNSWVYSNLFSNAPLGKTDFNCDWSQSDFNAIVSIAIAAPQIATQCMATRTNAFQASTGRPALVTWSLGADYNWLNYTRADGVVAERPFNGFGYNLSYCFANARPCNDWDADGLINSSDGDVDGDKCGDAYESILGINRFDPWDFYSVPVPALFNAANPIGLGPDSVVAAGDAQAVWTYFGVAVGSQKYEQDLNQNGLPDGWEYDRSNRGSAASGPPDGFVSAIDAQTAFAQFSAHFSC